MNKSDAFQSLLFNPVTTYVYDHLRMYPDTVIDRYGVRSILFDDHFNGSKKIYGEVFYRTSTPFEILNLALASDILQLVYVFEVNTPASQISALNLSSVFI